QVRLEFRRVLFRSPQKIFSTFALAQNIAGTQACQSGSSIEKAFGFLRDVPQLWKNLGTVEEMKRFVRVLNLLDLLDQGSELHVQFAAIDKTVRGQEAIDDQKVKTDLIEL